MNEDKTQEILLQLLSDMSYVKAKLDNIDELRLSNRVDLLEAQTREQDRIIKSLEKRSETMEKHVRDTIVNSNNTQRGIFISAGLAVFGALISLFINLI